MIALEAVTLRIGDSVILDNISYTFHPGKTYGIIGPNGAGKSTLLHTISGFNKPATGEVQLHHQSIAHITRKQLAKQLAVLDQDGLPHLSFAVKDIVAMGRYPYQNLLGIDEASSSSVQQQIKAALDKMGLSSLQNKKISELSGGERQRVAIAQLMVQNPQIVLLDEPTTHLDIGYQLDLMDEIQRWKSSQPLTVIAVLHDLNIAALYCDELIVIHHGKLVAAGAPADVLTVAMIRDIYQAEAIIQLHPTRRVPQIMLSPSTSINEEFVKRIWK